ncbi:MAG: Cobalt/magnesium transport protein CorA [Anaerolineales bacterium]|nr:Cobalt/magnesium transport protein CorA [Anaerolineales bacterium]
MIRSLYHHGAEIPATDLSQEQMQAALADAGGLLWVDMTNSDPEDVEETLTRVFKFHPLTINDCIEGMRQPKLDDHGEYVFLVVYATDESTPAEDVSPAELDIFVGPNFLVTHHPVPLPAIDRITEQAMQAESTMNRGADMLAYKILQAVTSDHRSQMNFLSAAIVGVEVEVLTAPTSRTLRRMHELRHENLRSWRFLAPQLDIVNRLATEGLQPIDANGRLHFQELADRVDHLVETTNTMEALIHDALQTHLSVVAGETKSLLRLVAALATILVPLAVLALLLEVQVGRDSAVSQSYAGIAVAAGTLVVALALGTYVYHRH